MDQTNIPTIRSVQIPRLYQFQREILWCDARHVFVIAGRRIGKTLSAQVRAIRDAVRGKMVLWVAPVFKQLRDNYEEIAELAKDITIKALTNDELIIYAENGATGRIRFRSADSPDNLRGQTADTVIFDEICFCKSDEHLKKCLKVLRPMLTERQGRFFFISSPNGHNYAHTLYETCCNSKEWFCAQYTWEVSPHIKAHEVAKAKAEMLESEWRQEFLGSFEQPTGAIFDNAWLDPKKLFITEKQMDELGLFDPKQHQRSFVAVDLALGQLKGKRLGDYQAVVALIVKNNICYVDCWAGRVPIPTLAQKVKEICDHWQVEGSAWEDNGFQSLAQADFIRLHEVTPQIVTLTNQVEKSTRIARLATLLKRGELRILDNEGGKLLFQHLQDFPMGKHSFDTLDALEMCWRTLTNPIHRRQ